MFQVVFGLYPLRNPAESIVEQTQGDRTCCSLLSTLRPSSWEERESFKPWLVVGLDSLLDLLDFKTFAGNHMNKSGGV